MKNRETIIREIMEMLEKASYRELKIVLAFVGGLTREESEEEQA